MTKRSPDQTSPQSLPPPKHARQECPSPPSLPLRAHPHSSLPSKRLQQLIQHLRISIESDDEIIPEHIYHLVTAVYRREGALPEDFVDEDAFKTNFLQEGPQFSVVLRRAIATDASEDDQRAFLAHSVFWTASSSLHEFPVEPMAEQVPSSSQNKAVQDSWMADFVDQSPLEGLRKHIIEQLALGMSPETLPPYGRYCSIIQSSGMGKSRLLDEFSKDYFLIPINLRAQSGGYPPADHDVRNFLAKQEVVSHLVAISLIRRFLHALFKITAETLKTLGPTKSLRIQNFRSFMSKNQSMASAGNDRQTFYKGVIALAQGATDEPDSVTLIEALKELRNVLNGDDDPTAHSIRVKTRKTSHAHNRFVDVFIAFDEAHTLAESVDDQNESRFVVLRRELCSLSTEPLFLFFLSTNGKVTQFGQPRGHDPSNRINYGTLTTPRPYIYLGFDQLMQNRKVLSRWKTLEDVTSLECIAHMGRPLWGTLYDHGDEHVRQSLLEFAVQKLLCGDLKSGNLGKAQVYAVLSQRLALDANTPQYFVNAESPLEAVETMRVQIANHMRVCVSVGDGIESLRAIASSEPILSEAASYVMIFGKFHLPLALSIVLGGFCISQGDRGELLVASFFTWARDQVVFNKLPRPREQPCFYFSVRELFESLFSASTFASMLGDLPSLCHSTATQRPFGEVFVKDKAMMHFNHVIKPQEQKILARRYLLAFMTRGAAALGANCQPGLDAVYPYLYDGIDLNVKQVGFIIVQVKNDSNANRSGVDAFKKMDPFKCGLLSDSDKVDGRFPIPIIRILFSLSGPGPAVTHQTYESPSEGATILGGDGQPLFTSYDYVCSGVSPEILRPVEDSPDIWAALVNKTDPWKSFYEVTAPNVLRSQLPACGSHNAHFCRWLDDIEKL